MKKVISYFFALCILFSTVPLASAEDSLVLEQMPQVNLEAEIARATAGISDMPITEEIKASFRAVQTTSTGKEVPVEVLYTVRDLGHFDGNQMYALTATAATKTDSGASQTADPVNVRVSGTLYWTDNLGSDNSLDRLTGTWTCYDGSWISSRFVRSHATNLAMILLDTDYFEPQSNSFDKRIGLRGHNLASRISATCHAAKDTSGTDGVVLSLLLESKYLA